MTTAESFLAELEKRTGAGTDIVFVMDELPIEGFSGHTTPPATYMVDGTKIIVFDDGSVVSEGTNFTTFQEIKPIN